MLRIVIWPVIVFASLGAVLFALIVLATPEQALLTQDTINSVSSSTAPITDALGFDDPAANTAPSEDPRVAELRRLQEKIQAVLINATGYAMILGLILAITWGFYARSLAPSIAGPKSQRRAFPLWFGLLIVNVVAFGICYWFLALDPLIAPNPAPYYLRLGAITVAGVVGYWIATALAASVTMRPSVPLASILTRPTGR